MAHVNELRAEFSTLDERIQDLTSRSEPLTDEETTELEAADKRAEELIAEIRKAEEREARRSTVGAIKPAPESTVQVTKNEPTYHQRSAHSHFLDLANLALTGDLDARDRLFRNNAEVRDLTRTDGGTGTTAGAVGEFVPPAWLLDLYQPGLRASRRVTANLVRHAPLPGGTDSINIPKIRTNPTVAAQTADNQTVNEVDAVSNTVTAAVQTFAGQNDIALQVIEQSPLGGGFDGLIFSELTADMDRYVDLQVLNGTGANGQVKGIIPSLTSTTKVAYTDGTPTVPELFPSFGKLVSLISSNRYDTVDAMVMHPRRWYWLVSQVDSSNRAYLVPTAGGPNNAYGTQSNGGISEGPVGQILGIPVYLDPNMPVLFTNGAGAAGTEDMIIAGHFSDAILFEGNLRTRVLPEVLSGTLTVRCQVYEYAAFTAERTTVGFGNIYDTGMAAPSGY